MPFSLLQTKRSSGIASGVGVALGRCGSWMTLTRPFHFPFTHATQPCLSSCNRVCICICTSSRHGSCPIPRPTGSLRALLTATRALFDCPYLCIVKGASPGTQGMCAFSPPIARLASRPWPVLTQTWHADEPRRIISPKRTCPISPS